MCGASTTSTPTISDSVAMMNHGVDDCMWGCVILGRDDRANYGTVCVCDALRLATLRISEMSVSRDQRILVLEMAYAWIGCVIRHDVLAWGHGSWHARCRWSAARCGMYLGLRPEAGRSQDRPECGGSPSTM